MYLASVSQVIDTCSFESEDINLAGAETTKKQVNSWLVLMDPEFLPIWPNAEGHSANAP